MIVELGHTSSCACSRIFNHASRVDFRVLLRNELIGSMQLRLLRLYNSYLIFLLLGL